MERITTASFRKALDASLRAIADNADNLRMPDEPDPMPLDADFEHARREIFREEIQRTISLLSSGNVAARNRLVTALYDDTQAQIDFDRERSER